MLGNGMEVGALRRKPDAFPIEDSEPEQMIDPRRVELHELDSIVQQTRDRCRFASYADQTIADASGKSDSVAPARPTAASSEGEDWFEPIP